MAANRVIFLFPAAFIVLTSGLFVALVCCPFVVLGRVLWPWIAICLGERDRIPAAARPQPDWWERFEADLRLYQSAASRHARDAEHRR